MKGKYFIDTNIILYSFDKANKDKKRIATDLLQSGLVNNSGRISFQVIQEFINVASKGKILDLKTDDLVLYTKEILIPLCESRPSFDLIFESIQIKEKYKYSFYDSMIIESALDSKCTILYSEDLHHGQKIKGLEIINPFS